MAKKAELSAAGLRRSKGFRELRRSLVDNLEARGLSGLQYTDMVGLYMDYWVEVRLAQAEIDEKGLNILDERRGSLMANPACAIKRNATSEMRKIFSALGFEAEARRAGLAGEDEDEL